MADCAPRKLEDEEIRKQQQPSRSDTESGSPEEMEWPVAVPLDDSIRHALGSPHPGILRAATRKHQRQPGTM
jgi:hypothetical protein